MEVHVAAVLVVVLVRVEPLAKEAAQPQTDSR